MLAFALASCGAYAPDHPRFRSSGAALGFPARLPPLANAKHNLLQRSALLCTDRNYLISIGDRNLFRRFYYFYPLSTIFPRSRNSLLIALITNKIIFTHASLFLLRFSFLLRPLLFNISQQTKCLSL